MAQSGVNKAQRAQRTPALHTDTAFAPFREKMKSNQLPEIAIRIFEKHYRQLYEGATGFIRGDEALPVESIPDYADLQREDAARVTDAYQAALARTVVLKLNGGLGTSMGMAGPKSLLPVKDSLTFLDIIVRQVEYLRTHNESAAMGAAHNESAARPEDTHAAHSGIRLPLVLMNSFSTQAETAAELARLDWQQDIPLTFVQHMMPKIRADTLEPVTWPDDPQKEWCPPGHGDIYAALLSSGLLAAMLDRGYEYLFVSNSDNLGAVLDKYILSYIARHKIPFLLEVARRTAADRKGGHLAQRPDGQLILRELSQCPPDELADFQDIERYRFFNTNSLWIHLPALQAHLDANRGMLSLPLIRNEKPVDPTQIGSPRVYQLETAMGAAIAHFEGAQALCVPRTRFVPVKKNSDLLVLWSDAYRLTQDYRVALVEGLDKPPLANLDDRFYQQIADLQQRFPHGAPSMARCRSLTVEGDVYFGRDVTLQGDVVIKNLTEQPVYIPDGAQLAE